MSFEQSSPEILEHMVTVNGGETLAVLAEQQPVMLVFLRFFGCSFCREAISDIAAKRKSLESKGIRLVFVHMAADAEIANTFFKKYKLYPVDHVADPAKVFYRAFGLGAITTRQLLGFTSWIRGFQAAVLEGHGGHYQSEELGDGFQMPGVFVVYQGQIRSSFVHKHHYDRPDYEEICSI